VIRPAASLLDELRAVDESSTIEAKTASRMAYTILQMPKHPEQRYQVPTGDEEAAKS
jgi:hypothetical protein